MLSLAVKRIATEIKPLRGAGMVVPSLKRSACEFNRANGEIEQMLEKSREALWNLRRPK